MAADLDNAPETSGYQAAPPRSPALTMVLFTVVVVSAAAVAHLFRETSALLVEWYSDDPDLVAAATSEKWVLLFGIVSVSVFVAACVGRRVEARRRSAIGIEAVAASARGEPRRISLRASGTRAAATWVASTGLSSIGRESAIIEVGGALGTVAGRRAGGRGDALATAGIAAGFASAYHAPIAALLYLDEHLSVVRSRRALLFATTGAVGGHLVSVLAMGGHGIFPAPEGSRWRILALSLMVLVPAALGARLFRIARVRVKAVTLADRIGVPWWSIVAVFALVAGAAVATFPYAAGNGMEALRGAAAGPTVAIAVALSVGKLVGTTASLGSGAPGGALTPTIGIAAGTGLLSLFGAEALGVDVEPAIAWGVMVSTMAVGVSVGMRSPLLAVMLVPELVGDYTILPLIAVVVLAAKLVDVGVDFAVARFASPVPDVIYEEDG
ncbi:chloride channel protein [Desertimonas flava]|uniref:chloride channel protein n=1 Tax=Desertimonas flava TaxID=2064846 RepID=UPI0013C4EA5F|nr:chloride channel protein [Desertimonas flava]